MAQNPALLLNADVTAAGVSDISEGFWSKGTATDGYDTCWMRTTYRTLLGRLLFSKAAQAPQNSRTFRVTSPVSQKIVDWQMSRQGLPPISPLVVEDDGPLLFADIAPMAVLLMEDGITKKYTITGQYIYALTVAKLPGNILETWKTGKAPPVVLSNESTTLVGEDFSDLYKDTQPEPDTVSSGSPAPDSKVPSLDPVVSPPPPSPIPSIFAG